MSNVPEAYDVECPQISNVCGIYLLEKPLDHKKAESLYYKQVGGKHTLEMGNDHSWCVFRGNVCVCCALDKAVFPSGVKAWEYLHGRSYRAAPRMRVRVKSLDIRQPTTSRSNPCYVEKAGDWKQVEVSQGYLKPSIKFYKNIVTGVKQRDVPAVVVQETIDAPGMAKPMSTQAGSEQQQIGSLKQEDSTPQILQTDLANIPSQSGMIAASGMMKPMSSQTEIQPSQVNNSRPPQQQQQQLTKASPDPPAKPVLPPTEPVYPFCSYERELCGELATLYAPVSYATARKHNITGKTTADDWTKCEEHWGRAAAEMELMIESLQKDLSDTNQKYRIGHEELEPLRQQVAVLQAVQRSNNMLSRHDAGHVKRNDPAPSDTVFPNGKKFVASLQADFAPFEDFAMIVTDMLVERGETLPVNVFIENLMKPLFHNTKMFVQHKIAEKQSGVKRMFGASVHVVDANEEEQEDDENAEMSLPKQFFLLAQQPRILTELTALSDQEVLKLLGEARDIHAHWDKDRADFSFLTLARRLLRVHAVAALSDARFYLYPEIGARVAYRENTHTEILTPGARKYGHIKPKEPVEVVLSGVYFDPPQARPTFPLGGSAAAATPVVEPIPAFPAMVCRQVGREVQPAAPVQNTNDDFKGRLFEPNLAPVADTAQLHPVSRYINSSRMSVQYIENTGKSLQACQESTIHREENANSIFASLEKKLEAADYAQDHSHIVDNKNRTAAGDQVTNVKVVTSVAEDEASTSATDDSFAPVPSTSTSATTSDSASTSLKASSSVKSDITTLPPAVAPSPSAAATAATIDGRANIPSQSVASEHSITTLAPPTSPQLSWLAVRLLESGVDAQLVKDCEQKLVVQEGFVSEADFAEMLPSELDPAYLKYIGIVGKGVQVKLMRLHKELYAQYAPASPTPPPKTPDKQNPPEATWAFTCGATPIEDVQPLVTDAIALHGATPCRLLLRGRFSGTVTDLNRVYTKDYSCVIKCAGQEAVSATDSDGARGIQKEFQMYAHLQELARLKIGKASTGCIACYHMHLSAHYLVLENYGQDIRTLLVPNFALAPQLTEAIIVAVNALHAFAVVHCDIKPHNVLFGLDKNHRYIVKLCDLDSAHKVGDVCAASALGTKQYEVPEVYFASRAGEKVTAALSMDMFSLGIVLWQVLSRSPYPPMSVEQLHKCYSDQDELYLRLALSESTSMYQSLLYSCVKLKPPEERITSGALYQRVRDIAVSKAHPAWHRAQQENEFLKEKVSDQLDGLGTKLDTVLEVMKARFDALDGEVVGLAEVLRREILLGHEGHSRVLASMREATQDALELLSDAQEATNISSAEHTDQILSCIHHLQSRMDRHFAADNSRDNALSSNTVGLEALLRGASDELHARFNSLSSQLQEQVQQQSAAGADSARARAEALEMNQALSASLQQALKGIASVQSEVYMLRQGQEQLGVQVGRVLQDNKRLDTMLRTLLAGTHNIPTYAIILPVVAKTWLKKADPMRLVRNKYRLYFLCSHTHQIAPCGPKGEGYKITVTKQWVRDAAPVLMAALVMLKLALMAGGIPLPVPDLSSLLISSALHVKFLDAALHLVQNPPEDHGAAEFAMDKSISLLGSVGTEEVMEDIGRRRVSLEEGSLKAYATIQSVLTTDSIDIALSSGLRQVVHPATGRTAWVLDNESVVEQYYMSA